MAQIIVGVPGAWRDRSAFVRAVASAGATPRYRAAGALLLDQRTDARYEVEVYDRDPSLVEAFSIASGRRLTPVELAAIASHTCTVYLVGSDPSLTGARAMIEVTDHLLVAGGLAVKIESSGLAHGARRWRKLAADGSTLATYSAFVTLVGGGGGDYHYSCGMHNLGMPDGSIDGSVNPHDAASILTAFNHWRLLERPRLEAGDWFAPDLSSPGFTLSHHEFGYDEGDPLNNPLGRWHLERATDRPSLDGFADTGGRPLFMALPKRSPQLRKALDQARVTVDYFIRHFRDPDQYGTHLFKVRLPDGDDSAYVWVRLVDASDAALTGEVIEIPPDLGGYCQGQRLTVPRSELCDWAIIKGGALVGGFSMRVQREHLPLAKRRYYDLYSGTLSYAPVEEIPGLSSRLS